MINRILLIAWTGVALFVGIELGYVYAGGASESPAVLAIGGAVVATLGAVTVLRP